MKEAWRRAEWLMRRDRFRAELDEEMRFHVECRAEELEAGGMSRDEARRRARREFGGTMRVQEDSAQAWGVGWIEGLAADLRQAGRALRRNPGFALTAAACLALGTGANLAIFQVTTSFLFSEPTCRDVERVVAIREAGNTDAAIADYRFLEQSGIFAGMAGINPEREVNWRSGDKTRRLYAATVTGDAFSTLGVPFRMGRGIAPGETGAAVISTRVWEGEFGGDPAVLGRRMVLDGGDYTVVGVLPDDHRSVIGFGIAPDVYIPVPGNDDAVMMYGRLKPGMSIAEARARLMGVLGELDRVKPEQGWKRASVETRVFGVTGIKNLDGQSPGAVVAFFAMLATVVGLVLLIACTNVASMLLARAASRGQELTIRVALGAGRMRLMRHLLAESLILTSLGAAGGIAISAACGKLAGRIRLPLPLPFHLVVRPDWRLLWYALALVAAATLLCGLLPAMKAVRGELNPALKRQERQTEGTWSARGILVTGQIAVSAVLLAAGFLFLHNLARATTTDPGFDVRHTIWSYMRLAPGAYSDKGQNRQTTLVRQALDELRALPGVESAAIARVVPLNDNWHESTAIRSDGARDAIQVQFEVNDVGPEYFRTLAIPILAGREFNAGDRKGSQKVVIVNEEFARQVFGRANAVGHTILSSEPGAEPLRIVGLAKNSKYFVIGEKQKAAVYHPYFAGDEPVNLHFLVRVAGPPASYAKTINDVLGKLDGTAAIETKPMSGALGLAMLPSQAGAMTLGAVGFLGLALAAAGLYGVLLYTVSRRTREIGLRVALGARPIDVAKMVSRQTLMLAGAGLAVGLGIAYFALQPLALFLVADLNPVDAPALAAVTVVLSGVALLATVVPVRRALRVDPMEALRCE